MCLNKTEAFIAKIKNKGIHKEGHYSYHNSQYIKSNLPLSIYCNVCKKEFNQPPTHHLRGSGCTICGVAEARRKRVGNLSEFINKVEQKGIHKKGHYSYENSQYICRKTKISIYCNICKKSFLQPPDKHLKGQGCYDCGRKSTTSKQTQSLEYYLKILKEEKVHEKGRYSYKDCTYKDSQTKCRIYCNKCKKFFHQYMHSHIKGHGCNNCSSKSTGQKLTYSKEEFLNKIKNKGIHKEGHYCYEDIDYKNTKEKIYIFCTKCLKHFHQEPMSHLSGAGCPRCRSSRGENKVVVYLEKVNIEFKSEKRFNTCKNILSLPFDFFIPSHNLLVEVQGRQHYEPLPFFGGEPALKRRQARDEIKRNWAKYSPYRLIEIPYTEFKNIEKILEEELTKPVKPEPPNLFAQ